MILNIFDDIGAGISNIWSSTTDFIGQIGRNAWNLVSNFFNAFVKVFLSFIDSLTSGFGFKFSELLIKITNFLYGFIDFIFDFFNFFPQPFGFILSFGFMFILFLNIYKFIRG